MLNKVYVFGNPDIEIDNKPFMYLERLKEDFPQIGFIIVKPNEDLPIEDGADIYILDTVQGLESIKILDERYIDRLSSAFNASVHDYDLGFQLKYLKKLGKIKKVRILGLPMNVEIPYSSFHSSFKKFVEQDIHGS